MHESDAGLQLRGVLIIGPGHTVADAYHMLRTELQIEPERGAYVVTCYTPHDGKRTPFSSNSPQSEVLGLLPQQPCQFLLDQATTVLPPALKFEQSKHELQLPDSSGKQPASHPSAASKQIR